MLEQTNDDSMYQRIKLWYSNIKGKAIEVTANDVKIDDGIA